jgi:hypothetical protein
MDEPLQKLFGSATRLKLLRLFLFNPSLSFTASEAASRARVSADQARREAEFLAKVGLVDARRGSAKHYSLNPGFAYTSELQSLLLNTSNRADDIYQRLRNIGLLKLIVIGGVFIGEWGGEQADLFIVVNRLKEDRLKNAVKILESEIGRELRFAVLSEQEFFYRLNMNDRLVRDVFDLPHRIVFDQLDIGLK